MKRVHPVFLLIALVVTAALRAQTPLDTAFTYQGQLNQSNAPLTATADFQFSLWDAVNGGTQLGYIPIYGVNVQDGLFIASLDFGATVFSGDARWLEIAVRSPAGSGTFTTLNPRQPLTATPYARFSAAPWVSSGSNLSYSAGNVGIGTSSPTKLLDVRGASTLGGVVSGLHSAGNSAGAAIQGVTVVAGAPAVLGQALSSQGRGVKGLADDPAGVGVWGESGSTGGIAVFGVARSASGHAGFFQGGRNYFEGNVGIGVNWPAWPLSIEQPQGVVYVRSTDNTNGSVLELRNTAPSPGTLGAINFNNADSTYPGQIAYQNADNMTFRTNGYERMRINSEGRVGIGTATPRSYSLLDIAGRLSAGLTAIDAAGVLEIDGPNGNENVILSATAADPNHGYAGVCNEHGIIRAFMAVGYDGLGVVQADVKNFRVANPRDDKTDIAYACIEGPEVAAYVRGTATLVNGRAVVALPEHFQDVTVSASMTIQVTPCSAESRGLAVVEQSVDHFVVRELQQGGGSYAFHWRVEAVRRGFEDYRVIRPRMEVQQAVSEAR